MPTTIDSLELELQSNASSAISGLDALSVSLNKIKSATRGGVGLTAVANQVRNLNDTLKSVDGSSADKIERIANSLSSLKGLGQLKISTSIGNQLRNIGEAVNAVNGVDFSGISRISESLAPLGDISKASGLQSTITQLQKLPQLADTFDSIDIDKFTKQITDLSNALAPLANQLNGISTSFSRLPTNIRQTVSATSQIPAVNNNAAKSYINLYAKIKLAMGSVQKIAKVVGSWITNANSYIENVNLFNASMGEYASKAHEYASMVGELLGIDPSEFMRNQGIFMTLATGFGVASDKAYLMSKNLTQLGYDMSSFFNISYEDAMQKLQSAFSGELEPVRRLGYDLSQTTLKSIALAQGITKSFNEMNQAEKSQLRYIALMQQVTTVQGDMARTLEAPANQLRVLKSQLTQCARALGEVFIPALNAVLPYVIAAVKVLRLLAETIGRLVDFTMPEVDYSGITAGADAAGDLVNNLDDATKAAKKLKNATAGFDELNIISPESSDSDTAGGGFNFDLPTYESLGNKFIDEGVTSKADEIVNKMKEWLGLTGEINSWADLFDTNLGEILVTVGAIGGAFAAWKISSGLLSTIDKLKGGLAGISVGNIVIGSLIGAVEFIRDLDKFKSYFDDFTENGPNFSNVAGMISEGAGLLGDAFLLFGDVKVAGPLKIVQGVGEIIIGIKDMSDNGPNWENVSTLLDGISNVGIGIGALTGHWEIALFSVALQGILDVIDQVQKIQEAIKTGDWSGVDETKLIIGLLEAIVGVVVGIGLIVSKKRAASKASTVTDTITEATSTTSTVSETLNSGGLFEKLKTIAKDLAMGLVIITEVAAAVLLIVGAVILLGMELEQVAVTWEPVLTNGQTVLTAMGIGVALLVGIGVITATLGSEGGAELIANMGLGIAILAEIGVSAALFVAEIALLGVGLQLVAEAWQPVLDNGQNVAVAVGVGTAILAAVGVVTALLGSAAGELAANIGLGIAILAELGVATALFIVEIWAIGKGLDEIGKAWQPVLDNGETVAAGIGLGTAVLVGVGVVAALLGVATTGTGGMLPAAIGLGTAILLELGAAAALFIVEIWGIGKGLDEIGKAWQPVLDNGDTIATGIGIGTDILIGIGVVTAALGVATVATAGLLPLAIGLGTTLLVELAAAFVLFCESLVTVANELNDNLAPPLEKLNDRLPSLSTNMSDFVDFMTLFAGHVVRYTEVSAISALAGTVDTIIGWFTEDPIDKLAKDVEKVYSQTQTLNNKLSVAVPELDTARTLLSKYQKFLTELETLTNNDVKLSNASFVNMNEVGKNIVTGFVDGIKSKSSDFVNVAKDIVNGFTDKVSSYSDTSKSVITNWAANITDWFTGARYGNVNSKKWGEFATEIVNGFKSKLKSYSDSLKSTSTSLANSVINGFAKPNGVSIVTSFNNMGVNVIKGFVNGVNSMWRQATDMIRQFGQDIIAEGKRGLDEASPSKAFKKIGGFVVEGFNIGLEKEMPSSYEMMNKWLDGVSTFSPQVEFGVDTSALSYYGQRNIANGLSAQIDTAYTQSVTTEGFIEGMEQFYREYMEDTLRSIASDTKRQADKKEQSVVQLNARSLTNAVTAQQKANGYSFVK